MLIWLVTVATENICDLHMSFIHKPFSGETDNPLPLAEAYITVHVKAVVAGLILSLLCPSPENRIL